MERSGLTEKVGKESKIVFRFPDPGTIPPPVLQISVRHQVQTSLQLGA